MTTQVLEPNFKITLSPKKKTEKVLPTSNIQTSNTNNQSTQGNAPEISKQPTAQPPPTQSTTPKPQNSPTQAELAAVNQKKRNRASSATFENFSHNFAGQIN
jgi:hypothetical protein